MPYNWFNMTQTILIVEDDAVQRRLLEAQIIGMGYSAVTATTVDEALDALTAQGSDIAAVLIDMLLQKHSGLELFKGLREENIDVPVIIVTAYGSIDSVVDAMRSGATDFITKPIAPERLEVSLRNALKMAHLTQEVTKLSSAPKRKDDPLSLDNLIANSAAMQSAIAQVKRAAPSTIPVLIDGESGTGKEVMARALHAQSPRAGRPFVAVNCGAIPENLVESILFGHEKGAFTGAADRHLGKFQEATGGTLFLDEIGELPLDIQVKLLRALQEGEVDRVGGTKPVKVDIRLVSATNRNLAQMVAKNTFREDLFYRINVFHLTLPPLRERPEDIMAIADFLMNRIATREKRLIKGMTPAATELVRNYRWPGNIRQLENALFRAVVVAEGAYIDACDFPEAVRSPDAAPLNNTSVLLTNAEGTLRTWEDIAREAMSAAINACAGDAMRAATLLGFQGVPPKAGEG